MAVEWTITVEGKNEFGHFCRRDVRIDKSWGRSSQLMTYQFEPQCDRQLWKRGLM